MLVLLIGGLCWWMIRLKIEQEIRRIAILKNYHHH
jgi:hypothetical protein